MGFAMMWVEALAAGILWTALVLAIVTRMKRRWVAIVLGTVGIGGLWFLSVLMTISVGFLARYIGWALFEWDLSWAIAFTVAAVVVCGIGLRSRDDAGWRAAAWRRGRLAIGLAAMLILYYVTFWNQDLAMQARLEGIQAQAVARALSVAPARVPPDRNAAPLYRDAFTILSEADDPPEAWNGKWTEWLRQEVPIDLNATDPDLVAYVTGMEPAAALLRQAAGKPGCYFERDYGRPRVDMLMPELSGFQKGTRLLALEARVAAVGGNPDLALANVEALFRMTRHVEQDPILVSALVAMFIDGAAVRTLETLAADENVPVATVELDPSQFYNETLPRAFRMEEAFGLSVFCDVALAPATLTELAASDVGLSNPARIAGWPWVERTGFGAAYRVFILPPDIGFYMRAMQQYQSATAVPYHEAIPTWELMEEQMQDSKGKGMGVISAMIVPALYQVSRTAAAADARHNLARLALAMHRCRAKTGAYPDSLGALLPGYMPAVPRDPFDGKPLRMVRRDGHIVLYSVGADLKDDGGVPWDDKADTGDLVFRLTIPGDAVPEG